MEKGRTFAQKKDRQLNGKRTDTNQSNGKMTDQLSDRLVESRFGFELPLFTPAPAAARAGEVHSVNPI